LDDVIQCWDLRKIVAPWNKLQPLREYRGHVPFCNKKLKGIPHPVFYNPFGLLGQASILTGGQGGDSLSFYRYVGRQSSSTGSGGGKESAVICESVHSRGALPSDCGDAGSIAVAQHRLALSSQLSGEIILLGAKAK
jgi:hypothetical protein